MNAFKKHFSEKNLRAIWLQQRQKFSKNTTPGVDGQTRSSFAANIENEIQKISSDALSGNYVFSALKPIPITKPNGGIRLINVPTIRDRFVQRAILQFFREEYSTRWALPHSFSSLGLVHGTNKEGAHNTLSLIKQRINYEDWVIKADLSKFFDTIERDTLLSMIKKRVPHRSFHPIITSAIVCEADLRRSSDKAKFKKAGLLEGRGIRQGMPLSPVLAFLYLSDLDACFEGSLFRYVDDMVFTSETQSDVVLKFNQYKAEAEKRGLTIHPISTDGKTQLIKPRDSFEFLGLKIVRSQSGTIYRIPSSSKKKIEERLLGQSKFPFDNKRKQKGWLLSAVSRTSGLIRDYHTAYGMCEDWNEFEGDLKRIRTSMCNRICKEIHLAKKDSQETLLRAFGVKD